MTQNSKQDNRLQVQPVTLARINSDGVVADILVTTDAAGARYLVVQDRAGRHLHGIHLGLLPGSVKTHEEMVARAWSHQAKDEEVTDADIQFETQPVAAANNPRARGRDIVRGTPRTHTVDLTTGEALCGRVKAASLLEGCLTEEEAAAPATCPTCAKRDPRFVGGAE